MYSSAKVVHNTHINDSITVEELNEKVFYKLHIPAVIFVSVCMVTGVIGNIIVLTIYKTRFRRSNHRYFILFIGVVDLIACLTGMPFLIASLRLPYMMTSVIACKVLRCIHYTVNNSSGLLLVVISIERYRKICRPFKKQFNHRQILYICTGTIVFSVLVAAPSAIFYGNNTIQTGIGNITGTQCYVADEYTSNRYFEMYQAGLLLETFICIIIFAVLYSFIIRKLWASDQFIETMRSIQKKSRKADRKDHMHSTDELNSIEESMDSRCESVYEKEHHRINRWDDSNKKWQNGRTSSNNSTCEGKPMVPPVKPPTVWINGPSKNMINGDTFSKQNIPNNKLDRTRNSELPSRHLELSLDRTSDIDNKSVTNKSNELHVPDGNGVSRPSSVRGLTPAQKQAFEHLLKKQTLERDRKCSKAKGKKNSKTTARVTVMLFTVTMVFVLAFVPHLTLMLLTAELVNFVNSMTVTELMVYHVFLRIFIINNVANPIIYLIFDVKFRTLCKSAISKCCRSKRQ